MLLVGGIISFCVGLFVEGLINNSHLAPSIYGGIITLGLVGGIMSFILLPNSFIAFTAHLLTVGAGE